MRIHDKDCQQFPCTCVDIVHLNPDAAPRKLAEVVSIDGHKGMNIADTLRQIAKEIDEDTFGDVTECAMVLNSGSIDVFGFGTSCTGATTHILLHAGQLQLALGVLEHEED